MILLLLFLIISCATTPLPITEKTQEVIYKKDMNIKINGLEGEGMLVAPLSGVYYLDINLKGKADMFILTTCHRNIEIPDAGQNGWFPDKKRVKYTYMPTRDIEALEPCPVYLSAFEEKKQRHSFGFIDFQSPDRQLKATIKCNGTSIIRTGVSVCQSKKDLIQEVVFDNEVYSQSAPKCPELSSENNKKFRFNMGRGTCIYVFEEKDSTLKHRLTTFGYDEVLFKGE